MNAQAKLHLVTQNHRQDIDRDMALAVLQKLFDVMQECEEDILNLPLKQYEIINWAVPTVNVRNQVSRLRERFGVGIDALSNPHLPDVA